MNDRKKKEISYVFNKDIDDFINGVSVSISLIIISFTLSKHPNYFHFELLTSIVRLVILIVGVLGIGIQISNTFKIIKGLRDITIGGVLLALSYISFTKWGIFGLILNFFVTPISLFGFIKGIMCLFYSIYLTFKITENTDKILSSKLILLITQLVTICLSLAQILEIIMNLKE